MRYYSSVFVPTQLAVGISSTSTQIQVTSLNGAPTQTPWTAVIDPGTDSAELVDVTAVQGLTLTVTRGVSGTTPVAHDAGATLDHVTSARDFSEPQTHIAASSNVHGVSGALVGTTDTQTLTNKTIDGSANTLQNIPLSAIQGSSGLVTTSGAQTLTNKTLSGADNTFSAIPLSALVDGSKVVLTDAAQTLTGKTIDGSTNTLQNIPQSAVSGLAAALAGKQPLPAWTKGAVLIGTGSGQYGLLTGSPGQVLQVAGDGSLFFTAPPQPSLNVSAGSWYKTPAAPGGSTLTLLAGTMVVTTADPNGGWSFTLPNGMFPNGMLTAVVCAGDATAYYVTLNSSLSARNALNGIASTRSGGAPAQGTPVRINYVAIGW